MTLNDQTCVETLQQEALAPAGMPDLCRDFIEQSPSLHDFCHTLSPGAPYQAIFCFNGNTGEQRTFPVAQLFQQCAALEANDPAWQLKAFFCCCPGARAATSQLLATENGKRPTSDLVKGDKVIAAHYVNDGEGTRLLWSSAEIAFVAGLDEAAAQSTFVSAGGREIFCAPDMPVLLANGTITTAERLKLGDVLVDEDGSPAPVEVLGTGKSTVSLHSVGVSRPFDGSLNGRLVSLGGLIVGDYELQIRLKEVRPDLLAADHAERQTIETTADRAGSGVSFLGTGPVNTDTGGKTLVRTMQGGGGAPVDARTLFTQDQATDVAANGSLLPLTDSRPARNVQTATTLLNQLYPKITFTYDPNNLNASIYAYRSRQSGQQVLINGGLARQAELGPEGVMMALAWGAACVVGGKPANQSGYSAVGQADLYAFRNISRQIWSTGSFVGSSVAAMNQWQALFDLVDPSHAGGDPGDPINNPSLDCRIQAIQSGIGGGGLPDCAGGQPIAALDLVLATTASLSVLRLGFDAAVLSDGVTDTGNYVLQPTADITSACVDPSDGKSVLVITSLTTGQQYQVTVANLSSVDGGALNPKRCSLEFTAVG